MPHTSELPMKKAEDAKVPELKRKNLDEISEFFE